MKLNTPHRVQYVRCMRKCNIDAFVEVLLDFPWNTTMDVLIRLMISGIHGRQVLLLSLTGTFLKRKVRVKANTKPWMNDYIRKPMRARNYYRTKFRKHHCWESFRSLRNRIKTEIRKAKIAHFETLSGKGGWKDLNHLNGRNRMDPFYNGCFGFEDVEESVVSSCLSKLNPRKATGADGLSPKLLKISSSVIGSSLAKLFNFCIRIGEIPNGVEVCKS